MRIDKSKDYANNLINVKKLTVLVEKLYNDRNINAALEAATELSIEARHMKTILHHQADHKK